MNSVVRSRAIGAGLVVAAFAVLVPWALSSPPGSSPDDIYHMQSIWCARGAPDDQCAPGPEADTLLVPSFLVGEPCFARDRAASGACQAHLWDDLTLVPAPQLNAGGTYPPRYYDAHSYRVGSRPLRSVA